MDVSLKIMSEDKEPMTCDCCGKNMTDRETGTTVIGASFSVKNDVLSDSFLQKQLGEYVIGRSYNSCFECFFKNNGFKA